MILFIYRTVITLLLPFMLLYLCIKSCCGRHAQPNWKQYLGFAPKLPLHTPTLWLHAVSVGETAAAIPLLRALRKQYPDYQLLVTNTTHTGKQTLQRADISNTHHCYFPYDAPSTMKRFLKRVQPKLIILIETEIWPQLFSLCHQRAIPIILANARLSAHSFDRFSYLPKTSHKIMQALACILAQSTQDAGRFLALGADRAVVQVTGNLKFDLQLPSDLHQRATTLKQPFHNRVIWLAASTHQGEEQQLLEAFTTAKKQFPNLLLILAPRHPQRTDEVSKLCQHAGWKAQLYSNHEPKQETDILIINVLGQLLYYYQLCDIAFVGGSLLPNVGGHNPLEPASLAKPIISGAHMTNCAAVNTLLLNAKAIINVSNTQQLTQAVTQLLADPTQRTQMGNRALQALQDNTGVLQSHLHAISRFLLQKS